MIRKALFVLLVVIVIVQFFRPEKNLSANESFGVSTRYQVQEPLAATMKVACNDCHTNKTRYPWYAEMQPAGWLLNKHVVEGTRHLNFSEFTNRPIAVQNHKFEEIIEMVEEGDMPLPSYTWLGLHPDARLSDTQRSEIIAWAKAQMDTLKAKYPADSLVLRRRPPPPGQQ